MVFFAGCCFRILLFPASASFQLCLPRVPLIGSLASLPFLSLGSRLLPPLSLLRLFPLPGSSPLVLRAFSCLVVFLSLFLLGRFIISSVYWPSVVFVHLLRNSVESQFLRDGVLPLVRVISYDFFVYGQVRGHAPGCCCCSLFPREGLRLCLLFLIPCSVCIGVSPLPRSFRVPSSRVPPWGLSLVLSLLRGAPFEPLVSCSLRVLTRKLLFLLSLATARRVGELQAVAAVVSFSGGDTFLS